MYDITFNEINLLLALLVVVLGSWSFMELADEVSEGETLSFDKQILIALRSPDNPADPIGPEWVEDAMHNITSLGSTAVLVVLVVSVAGFLVLGAQYRQALLIVLASVTGVLLVIGLKALFIRDRPDVVPHLAEVTSGSYPSGHTMMSAVIYLSLASMLAHIQKQKRAKVYSIAIALILTFLIGISRIYIGVHYPTDVLAGWAVGLAWAALCWLLFRYIDAKSTTHEKDYDLR